MNERQPGAPPDERLEWDQDGQYFHYLTKWMHALRFLNRQTDDRRYYCWAVELAVIAHSAFTREAYPGGPKRIAWKMSIDLSRSLVSSMGQHDALDGLIAFLELQTAANVDAADGADLAVAIANMTAMCGQARWATDDPLGIGGLLDDAARLARLIFEQKVASEDLLRRLLVAVESSLQSFACSNLLRHGAEQRLPFRELGLSIGLHALDGLHRFTTTNPNLAAISDRLLVYQPLAEQIENFWSHPAHRLGSSWCDHRDINTVMLATSLAPAGYLCS
jgi:hypothetical protein